MKLNFEFWKKNLSFFFKIQNLIWKLFLLILNIKILSVLLSVVIYFYIDFLILKKLNINIVKLIFKILETFISMILMFFRGKFKVLLLPL